MHSSLGWLALIVTLYSSMIFCADINNQLPLPRDIWVNVYNLLPLKDQYKLALTCTSLNTIFNSPAVSSGDESTVHFNQKNSLIDAIKNIFTSSCKDIANLQCTSFCQKIAANKIRSPVRFNSNNSQQQNLFFESLKANCTITALNVSGLNLGDYKVNCLASALAAKCKSSLKSLILRKNAITHTSVIFLLTQLPHLEDLDISRNNIGMLMNDESSFIHTSSRDLEALSSVMYGLKKLSINNNIGGSYQTWEKMITNLLKKSTKLEALHFANNFISKPGDIDYRILVVSTADAENSTLKILDLSNNEFCDPLNYDIKRTNLTVIL